MRRSGIYWSTLVVTILVAGMVMGRPYLPPPRSPIGGGEDGPVLTPAPVTVDRVVHNQGNIATTVDNYGYVGGWSYYGLPSGEWPRNSGHDYLAEIKYWIGAVTSEGDTLVANTDDDFQSIPSLITGVAENRILLSTDTSRYYDYDVSDTIGLGGGSPALGWRVWSPEANDWVYTRNYNPSEGSFFDGGPLSVQESHYRFADDALGASLMGLEMTHTVLQWNYCYNEDFMFVILEITNTTTEDFANMAFGLYVDLDIGGPDGTGENGRLGDLVASDSIENLAWIYDEDGFDPGWGKQVETGIMGTKYLETPGDVGMTSFRTGDWALVPDDDPGRYDLINSSQYDGSLPPTDQYYIQCTRGFSLPAGQTVRVVYALVAGPDEAEFRDNAELAQELYDNYFVGPQPPNTPTLTAVAGSEKVYLLWDDTAQATVDPLSGENDFAGYKLYRSDDRGLTWGEKIYNTGNDCLDLDYECIAQFNVNNPTDLIPRSIIDTDLINGVEYWYCLVAVDTGASETGVDVLQTGFGVPGSAPNIASVTPRTDPAGHYEATATVTHEYTGTGSASDGEVIPVLFDKAQLLGSAYQVVFEDAPTQTFWHLINVTTGDTLLANQTRVTGDPNLYEVAEGLRVVVRNGDRVPRSMAQTGFAGTETTLAVAAFYGPIIPFMTEDESNVWGDAPFRNTYELRYTGDANPAPSIWEFWYDDPTYELPFECWNTVTNQRVSLAVHDNEWDGVWQPSDPIGIIDYPYDPSTPFDMDAFPYQWGFLFELDADTYNPAVGDVLTIEGAPLNGPGDVYSFSPDGINSGAASGDLASIRVVPDPYYAYATQWEAIPGESNIQFQNLPERCTIRIYTLSGDLIRTLEHTNDTGTEEWNLQTDGQRLVVSGVYIYHVESQYGDRLGRFAVVK